MLSDELMIAGYNYPNLKNYPVARQNATGLPKSPLPSFNVNFANGRFGYFTPVQFHYHAPSEHTINGEYADLELHVVHVDNTTGTPAAVIGFLFKVSSAADAENTFLN